MNRRRGLFQMHIAAMLAGFTGLFGKFLAVSPSIITGGRTIVGCLAIAVAARQLGVSLRLKRVGDLVGLSASGVLLAAHWVTFFYSIQISTVAVGLLAFSSFPLFVTFLEPLFFRERREASDLVTAIAVVAGLALVVPRFDVSDYLTRGLLWGVLSGFLCAVVSMLSRSLVRDYPAVTVAFYQQGAAALCLFPLVVRERSEFSGRTVLLLLLLGIVFTAGLQILQVGSLRHLRAQTASVILALEPIYGILLAIPLLGEVPSVRTVLGGLLVCGAVFGSTMKHATSLPV